MLHFRLFHTNRNRGGNSLQTLPSLTQKHAGIVVVSILRSFGFLQILTSRVTTGGSTDQEDADIIQFALLHAQIYLAEITIGTRMVEAVPAQHVEQLALWRQWIAEKQRGVPGALRPWERKLLCWDAREPLDRQSWDHLRRWAERTGLIDRSPSLSSRQRDRDE